MPRLAIPPRRLFHRRLAHYVPSSYERFSADDRRFDRPGIHHALKSRRRLWEALATAARHQPEPAVIVDLGVYPGTLLRLLAWLCPDITASRYGASLALPADFQASMKSDCDVATFSVNLDPGHPRFSRRGLPTRLPLPDGVADLVFALEIVEHLVDPAHLFGEARRLLSPRGVLVVTTPNITRIGSVLKLLVGRTNLDRVFPPTREDRDPDWAPHLREYALGELLAAVGLPVSSCGRRATFGTKKSTSSDGALASGSPTP